MGNIWAWRGIVDRLLIQSLLTRISAVPLFHVGGGSLLLSLHAAAVAALAIEEEQPDNHPNQGNGRDEADANNDGDCTTRDASRTTTFQEACLEMGEGRHGVTNDSKQGW